MPLAPSPAPAVRARRRAAALAALLVAAGPAAAQESRPSEEELFGGASPASPAPAPSQPAPAQPPAGGESAREAEIFGGSGSPSAQPPPAGGLLSQAKAQENPLALGGQLYLRAFTTWQEKVQPKDWFLTSPDLVDLYLDVRPNDRVRGFVLGRMSYDPTLGSSGTSTVASALSGVSGVSATATQNPRAVLDQLWLNFDVLDRRAYLTVGRQHVKWGVGKFWNPTDYLHPVRRDPLAVFDARAGTTMVKLHVPWEKRGWNFYGVGVLEDVAGTGSVQRLGRLAGGGRAEIVAGPAELGLDALVQNGHHPRFGVDVSAGVWELDVYAEAALRNGVDTPRWREVNPAAASFTDRYRQVDPTGFTPQLVLGASWSHSYSDEDAFTVGGEYYYDRTGYTDARIYPALLVVPTVGSVTGNAAMATEQPFSAFYLGRHYAGAYLSLPKPGSWNNTTFTLSALGNLSDRSYIVRLDHSVLVVTYLRVETFAAAHLGSRGGEFRLGFDLPPSYVVFGSPAVSYAPPVLDLGIALRVSL